MISVKRFGMRLVAIADYAPPLVMTNDKIAARLRLERQRINKRRAIKGLPSLDDKTAKLFKTTNEWIKRSIGFTERRFAGDGIGTIDLATNAAQLLINKTNLTPEMIDGIVFATVSPSYIASNPDSTELQNRLGIPSYEGDVPRDIYCIDISLACSSWVSALQVVYARIASGMSKNILLVGADKMSSLINWRDRAFACVLGDAATATWCQAVPLEEDWFTRKNFWSWSDGEYAHIIRTPLGGSKNEITSLEQIYEYQNRLAMDGSVVKEIFVPFMSGPGIKAALNKVGWTLDMIDFVTMHEANLSQLNSKIENNWRDQGFTGQVLSSGGMFGNTTTASIPLAISLNGDELKVGKRFCLAAFGGGLSASIAFGQIKHDMRTFIHTPRA